MATILVVEDNDLNLKLFRDLLSIKNHNVIVSQEGFDALELAKLNMPDLILMDIQLRGISGIDIVKELKNSPQTSSIPVIAVTAFAMKDDEKRFLEQGCDMYLAKPLSIDTLYDAIDKYVK
ncbi:MAG UNVERIFIED_CONTAM: response regulator [Rickettsiaceae bacterium]|jgi:two-component system cell cycle response regulator DivK